MVFALNYRRLEKRCDDTEEEEGTDSGEARCGGEGALGGGGGGVRGHAV